MPENQENMHDKDRSCSSLAYQYTNVTVPVTVKPNAHAGKAVAFCCGEPVVSKSSCCLHGGRNVCGGCSFVVSQCICIEVPIEYDAHASIGNTCIECGEAD